MEGNSMHLRLLCILAVFCPIRVGEAMTLGRVESDLPDQVGAVDAYSEGRAGERCRRMG
jgi:hypothetical protein